MYLTGVQILALTAGLIQTVPRALRRETSEAKTAEKATLRDGLVRALSLNNSTSEGG
jgi:hypothetical protein